MCLRHNIFILNFRKNKESRIFRILHIIRVEASRELSRLSFEKVLEIRIPLMHILKFLDLEFSTFISIQEEPTIDTEVKSLKDMSKRCAHSNGKKYIFTKTETCIENLP